MSSPFDHCEQADRLSLSEQPDFHHAVQRLHNAEKAVGLTNALAALDGLPSAVVAIWYRQQGIAMPERSEDLLHDLSERNAFVHGAYARALVRPEIEHKCHHIRAMLALIARDDPKALMELLVD